MNDTEKLFYRYLYAQNEFIKANMDRKQQFGAFKSVFEDDRNQVNLLISALNYIGYFSPAPAPLYDPAIVANNPELNNSINYYLNQSTVDLAQYIFGQLLYQDSFVFYSCYILNRDQWVIKNLPLTNEFYTDLHQLLNKMESFQKNGETEHLFWDDEKFSELINAIGLINPNVVLQIPDYTAALIRINNIGQVYEMKDQQVSPAPENLPAIFSFVDPVGSLCNKQVFAHFNVMPAMKKLEANTDNAIRVLFFYTVGDKNTFDKLAKDFIHLAMHPNFKQRNTIVSGDIDKLGKWLNLIKDISNYVQFIVRRYDVIPPDYPYPREARMEYVPSVNEESLHLYCLCLPNNPYSDPGNKHIHLNFPYGGKYYELPGLMPCDLIWIAELLFAHGWHLINGAQGSRKARTRNIEKEFTDFLIKCDESNEIRIPAALVYQLYTAFAGKEKQTREVSDSELYRLIKEKGIEYGTFKSRDADISYISSELKPIMEKTGIVFEDKWVEKNRGNKSFKCTISDELWKTLAAPSPETESSVDEEKFGKFLKELFSRYEYIFKYEVPEFFAQNSESGNHTQKSEHVGSRYIK